MNYSADFETITDENDCRVWASGIYCIETEQFEYGNSIEHFVNHCKKHPKSTYYFHNLKFDGEFILYWLFQNGFKHTTFNHPFPGEFTSLISDMGTWYSLKINFGVKKDCIINIINSLNILNMSVKRVAKSFGLSIKKGEIDYDLYRPIGHNLTNEEVDYLYNDCAIMGQALQKMFLMGHAKITAGSNAFSNYVNIIGKKNFNYWFPVPENDGDIRETYKGAFVYVNPDYQGKDIGEGIVLDVTSLYPSRMYCEKMPYGEGVAFEGKYEKDELYDLYTQIICCEFELKPGHLPTLSTKNSRYSSLSYLKMSDGEELLHMTSVDLDLFLEHYNVYNIEWLGGWKYKSSNKMFRKYIDYWIGVKEKATVEGNEGMRSIAKLMLNSLYGKFALNPRVCSKYPTFDGEYVKYKMGEPETRKPIYIPVGTFITAYARAYTIRAAQKLKDRFLYADTDSLHLIGTEIPDCIEVHPTKLGAWKHEGTFRRARYVRQKSYIEEFPITKEKMEYLIEEENVSRETFYEVNGELRQLKITCAGMPDRCYKNVTWDNFHMGTTYDGKLRMKHVKNGIVLTNETFKLKAG